MKLRHYRNSNLENPPRLYKAYRNSRGTVFPRILVRSRFAGKFSHPPIGIRLFDGNFNERHFKRREFRGRGRIGKGVKSTFGSRCVFECREVHFPRVEGMPAGIGKGGRVIATEYCNNMQSI